MSYDPKFRQRDMGRLNLVYPFAFGFDPLTVRFPCNRLSWTPHNSSLDRQR